jgi:hypothetical protein
MEINLLNQANNIDFWWGGGWWRRNSILAVLKEKK